MKSSTDGEHLHPADGKVYCTRNAHGMSASLRKRTNTLLLVNSQNAINVALYEKLNFDFVRDIAPVGMVESFRWSWRSIPRCRPRPSPSSSLTPRPIPAS